MKIRKLITFVSVLALVLAVGTTALAANFSLPVPPDAYEQGGDFSCWELDAADRELFLTAKTLVLEMPQPTFEKLCIVVQGQKNSWSQHEFENPADMWKDGKITINFAAAGIVPADIQGTGEESWLKILAGFWGTPYGDWGITKAYFVYGNSSNPGTGDNSILIIALAVLALSAATMIISWRKTNKNKA